MKNIKDVFCVGVASLLLLSAAKQAGAQCVPAPPGTSSGGQSCPPITQVSAINSGFVLGLFPPAGPWVEFAVPHSALANYSTFINLGGGAACGTIPNPIGAAICTATVALEIMMWQQADMGQGVFATFWWDDVSPGFWTLSPCPPIIARRNNPNSTQLETGATLTRTVNPVYACSPSVRAALKSVRQLSVLEILRTLIFKRKKASSLPPQAAEALGAQTAR